MSDQQKIFETAVAKGDIEACRDALRSGEVDVNGVTNIYTYSPLQRAAYYGDTDMCKLLLSYGANPLNASLSWPLPALFMAIRMNRLEVVKLLLDHGVSMNTPELREAHTPLYNAVFYRFPLIVEELLKRGANVTNEMERANEQILCIFKKYGYA